MQAVFKNSDLPKPVRIRQKIAYWLLAIPLFFFILFQVLNSETASIITPYLNIFKQASMAIAYLLLSQIANNKASSKALIWAAIGSGVYAGWSLIMNEAEWVSFVHNILMAISTLLQLYMFAVILKNNSLDSNARSWIGILLIVNAFLLINLSLFAATMAGFDIIIISPLKNYYVYLLTIFQINAFFKFVQCDAFSGKKETLVSNNDIYTPINKYFLGSLGGAVITIGSLACYYWLI